MIQYIIAGLAGVVIGNYLEKNTKKSSSTKEEKKSSSSEKVEENPLTWKEQVNEDISNYGFDGAIREGLGWSGAPKVKNEKFKTLRKEYIKNADKFEKELEKDPVYDTQYEVSSVDAINKEGFDYAFDGYSDWEGVKRKKFHQLRDNYLKSKKALENI